jgi:hypothetical protein
MVIAMKKIHLWNDNDQNFHMANKPIAIIWNYMFSEYYRFHKG